MIYNLFFGLVNVLYYLFWPLIKIIEIIYPILKYFNPLFWKCSILHGVKWKTISFMYPFGIGGTYNKDGWWCQRCESLYCQKDTKK